MQDYVSYIVEAVMRGNSQLGRLLYQLAEIDIECIYPLTKHLIKAIKMADRADLCHIFKIMYLVSLSHVQVICPHL